MHNISRKRMRSTRGPTPGAQRGAALLVLFAILSMVIMYGWLRAVNQRVSDVLADPITDAALRDAKEAIVACAAARVLLDPDDPVSSIGACKRTSTVPSSDVRPGDLPCPDRSALGSGQEGIAGTSCNVPTEQIGRLPWRTSASVWLRERVSRMGARWSARHATHAMVRPAPRGPLSRAARAR